MWRIEVWFTGQSCFFISPILLHVESVYYLNSTRCTGVSLHSAVLQSSHFKNILLLLSIIMNLWRNFFFNGNETLEYDYHDIQVKSHYIAWNIIQRKFLSEMDKESKFTRHMYNIWFTREFKEYYIFNHFWN